MPLTASWPLNVPRLVQLPGEVVPLPPDHDQGTEAELLVHSITMPVPEQVVEVVGGLPELDDELDDGDTTGTGAGAGTELEDGAATTILFATRTELVVGVGTGAATGVVENALP